MKTKLRLNCENQMQLLNLQGTELGEQGVSQLCDVISKDSGVLRYIDISANGLEDSEREKMWHAIRFNESSCLGHLADDNYFMQIGATELRLVSGESRRHADSALFSGMRRQEVRTQPLFVLSPLSFALRFTLRSLFFRLLFAKMTSCFT